jgi:hypothetical protein
MKEIVTQSNIGIDEKGAQIYSAASEVILDEGKKITRLFRKFKAFCERQQKNRLGWTAIILAGQVFLLVPLTLLAISFNGSPFVLWTPVILSSFVTAVSNLLALPTKVTIPVFCASVLINVSMIMLSFML